jgi:RNA polymerase sigma-70 factor (ECF subfamily)
MSWRITLRNALWPKPGARSFHPRMAVAVPMPPPSLSSPPGQSKSSAPPEKTGEDAAWLDLFHRGDRRTMEDCYRRHFATVERAARGVLPRDEAETVIHEVFSRLVGAPDLRRSFRGGAFGAWIATVGRNLAIDYRRRAGREVSLGAAADAPAADAASGGWQDAADARLLVERFRREHLDPKWQGVFETRFLQQLPQRDAARRLGINRTTLAYREVRIRSALRRFLLDGPQNKGTTP